MKVRPLQFSYIFFFSLLLFVMAGLPGIKVTAKPVNFIMIDQFGYRTQDHKVAVIADPQLGSNAEDSFSPGKTYQVRAVDSDQILYSGTPQPWENGQTHSQSGDKAWWFDFSEVKLPGSYYIFDPETQERSFPFEIRDDVYRQILIAATRMFFYQRSGFAKEPPYADPRWTDAAAFIKPKQDQEARYLYDKDNASLAKNMEGGWFDAGDLNKYVTFATQPVHQLLSAYTQNPEIWTDDFNIPESGNGIPDLIDEIKFELDWLKKMQDKDGGVYIKLGNIDHNIVARPSWDKRPRYYAPKCSSATIDTSSMFAHAALVLRQFPPLTAYAEDLKTRALKAWQWYESHPKKTDCDSQEIKSGDADRSIDYQKATSVIAAIYLFALNPEPQYNQLIQNNLQFTRPFSEEDTWSRYRPQEGDALLFYTQLPKADAALRNQILTKFKQMVATNRQSYGFNPQLDPYRAYMTDPQYHWGSNAVKANYGNTNYDVIELGIDRPHQESYKIRALDHLHYFHGVNPLGLVYLSNMYEYGAENSANEIYHQWFGDGIYDNARTSKVGPAPGYLTGGPNRDYTGSIEAVRTQPPMKAYIDTNDNYPVNSWEITEPAIYYQSSYVKLLSKFVKSSK